jgi:plastocyanin
MSSARTTALASAALTAALAAAVPAASGDPLDAVTAVGVSEREFRITPYRRAVETGRVRFNVRNFGEDVHDLVVVAPSGRRLGSTGEIKAGRQGVLEVRLKKPGTYRLLCTQGDHARRGMNTRLVVRRPPSR